ncbi:ABC transporter substrate-binding protein [Planktothrix agardhii]|jgi:multiple sugar transport system substrate-binding protein|uniref:ABC transporter substrate-binding protein n=1 Tax=Planktothrix agardhii TaxID=1160 RepID=UPI002207AE70|nr:ABC transporter substrate-binding protein [Planktothrix agardhii]CAD5932039.1 Trehalose/maltose-binding protein MalE [Planktothrix agardhii]
MIFVKFKIPLFYKFILTLLIGVIISILMIKPAFTQQPVTLKVLVQALESTQWQPIINSFHQTHPKIRLEVVKAPNNSNLVEDLYTSAYLLGDSPYDLVYMDVVWVQKFAAAGWLEDLTKKVDPQKLTDYIQGDVQGGKYQNKLYRMPFRTDVGMLYYRTDLLEKAGLKPPKTFQDLLTTSQTLQNQNLAQWGYVWQGKQYEGLAAMFTEILQGYGGFWVNPETQAIGLDAPESIEAVNFLRQTIEQSISPPGVTTYAEEETRRLFESGNTVFLRNWPYVYALAANSPIRGKYGIQPMVNLPGKQSGACLGGWGFGISKSSKHQREAWQVIEYFNQPDIQRQYFLETGYVPSQKSLFTDDILVAKYNYLPALLQGAENAVLRPPIPQYAQVSDILQRYLSAALTGSKTPEAAMKEAARETRTLLNINE